MADGGSGEGRRVRLAEFRPGEAERAAVLGVLETGRVSEGPQVAAFEAAWAAFVGSRYAVATSSGTSALLAGLLALRHRRKLPPGSGVLTTPLTFIATTAAILHAGFEPLYADVRPDTFTLDPAAAEATLAGAAPQSVAAIVVVHLMGYPADLEALGRLAERYGLELVEDAAQAHGSRYAGRRVGSIGDWGTFSFYVGHALGCGELGAVVTSDPEVARVVRQVKDHGRSYRVGDDPERWFHHEFIGLNAKATELAAALVLPQIARAEEIIKARQANARRLNERLASLGDRLQLPLASEDICYMGYPIVLADDLDRGRVRRALEAAGVETRPLFSCLPLHERALAHLAGRYAGRLAVAERLGRQGLYLPCHQYLEPVDLDLMVSAVGAAVT